MVPQVLQLNEMQPCWEERLPHCPQYPPAPQYTHTNRASSHPTPMQFPPQLCSCLFISHLKGKCRGLLKLNQTYLLMIPGLPLWGWGSRALWHPDSHVWRSLPSFGQMLTTDVTSTGENTNCTGTAGEEMLEGGHGEVEVEKLREARGHEKRGRDRQRMRPHFHCWWLTACHPGSIMICDWQVEGRKGWGRGWGTRA